MSSPKPDLDAALQRAKADTASMTGVYGDAVQTYRDFHSSNDAVSTAAGAVMAAAIKAREKCEALERVLEAKITKQSEPKVKVEGARPQQQQQQQQQKAQVENPNPRDRSTSDPYPSNHAYQQQQQPQTRPAGLNPSFSGKKPKTTQYDIWWALVENAFFNYSSMSTFPEPPILAPCLKPDSCAAEKGRNVKACDCQIEAAFRYLVEHCGRNIKMERLRWHPDRFAQVRAELKQEFTMKANEVFRVLNRMYEAGIKPEAEGMDID